MKSVHAELLAGRRVYDIDGKVAGRIHSIHIERDGPQCVVAEYLLGTAAWLTRLGITAARLFGWRRFREPLRVRWDLLDLSDPDRPRLRCRAADLQSERKSRP
jgi:hypothetical protein